MHICLSNTSTRTISSQLQRIHETTAQTTGRVLTLIIMATVQDDLEALMTVTTDASREHPARVLVLVDSRDSNVQEDSRVDAEIRVGGDTGASELVVMYLHGHVADHPDAVVTPLLLPDTPIVAWWASQAPKNPAQDPIGKIAQRRITDCFNDPHHNTLGRRCSYYEPGDSDLAWARITQFRGLIASALDVYPRLPIKKVEVAGVDDNPSIDLLAGWLADRLNAPVRRVATKDTNTGGTLPACSISLHREDGEINVSTTENATAALSLPNKPVTYVALNARSLSDCLAEELRHLDDDKAYAGALAGVSRIDRDDD